MKRTVSVVLVVLMVGVLMIGSLGCGGDLKTDNQNDNKIDRNSVVDNTNNEIELKTTKDDVSESVDETLLEFENEFMRASVPMDTDITEHDFEGTYFAELVYEGTTVEVSLVEARKAMHYYDIGVADRDDINGYNGFTSQGYNGYSPGERPYRTSWIPIAGSSQMVEISANIDGGREIVNAIWDSIELIVD